MCNVELVLSNDGDVDLAEVKVGAKRLAAGMTLREFPSMAKLVAGASVTVAIGVDFNDTTQTAKFDVVASGRCHEVSLTPRMGELVRAVAISGNDFEQRASKLRGMNEVEVALVNVPSATSDEASVKKRIYEAANVLQVPNVNDEDEDELLLRFAGLTLATKSHLLLTVKIASDGNGRIVVNCEKIVVGNMMAKEMKKALEAH